MRRKLCPILVLSSTLLVSACSHSSGGRAGASGEIATPSAASSTSTPSGSPVVVASIPKPTPPSSAATKPTHAPTPTPTQTQTQTQDPTPTPSTVELPLPPSSGHPVIVLDPGHSVTVHATDPGTGLDVSDYENEPEMRDVFAVALLVKAQLQAAGYRVIMTKNAVDDPTSLGQRAAVANAAHAALALSIHDQAGSNGGIPFNTGNNIVYYQAVGDYRLTPGGKRVTFTNSAVAALSRRYGEIFQTQRAAHEGHTIQLLSNTGYDLGSRGLAGGDIWIVQLLSKVPWIYDEAGGNSPGTSGLDAADKQRYADGLVASVEHCVPLAK